MKPQAAVFDAYGTLFDVHSVVLRAGDRIAGDVDSLSKMQACLFSPASPDVRPALKHLNGSRLAIHCLTEIISVDGLKNVKTVP